MECDTYLRNVTDLLSDGKTPYERRFGQPFKGPTIPFGSLVEYLLKNCEGPVKNPSIWKESLAWIVLWIRFVRGENLEGSHNGCRHWGVGNDGRIINLLQKTQCKRGDIPQRKRRVHFSSRRWTNQIFLEDIQNWEHPPWYGDTQVEEKVYPARSNGRIYHPISAKDLSILHQFGPEVLRRIWKADILVADKEELEEMDAWELHAGRLNAKDLLTKGDNFNFPIADGTVKKFWKRSTSEIIHLNPGPSRTRRGNKFFEENQTDSLLQHHIKMTLHWMMRKLENDFWSITGDFIYRHHVELRVKLYVPTEESCLFHWNT